MLAYVPVAFDLYRTVRRRCAGLCNALSDSLIARAGAGLACASSLPSPGSPRAQRRAISPCLPATGSSAVSAAQVASTAM